MSEIFFFLIETEIKERLSCFAFSVTSENLVLRDHGLRGGGVPIVLALSVLNWNLQSDTLYHSEKWLSISQGPGTTDALWTRCGCFYDLGPFSLPGFNTGILSKAWRSEQHWSNIEIDQEADHVEYYKVNGCFEGY